METTTIILETPRELQFGELLDLQIMIYDFLDSRKMGESKVNIP